MEEKLQELNNACSYIIQQYASINISLDFSVESVKELDRLFDDEFKDGELVNPDSSFAKRHGFIMTGVAAYLSEVFIQHSVNSKIEIDPNDESWYVNFKVVAANGWSVEPGQRVIKRRLEGRESDFYHYVIIMLQYFTQSENDKLKTVSNSENIDLNKIRQNIPRKAWWKFWQR
ncbi:hypothetical protein [Ferruginibacter sp. SUN106]|uniref:hypothetical protein n=1 Tax=Ferruginibacter sp. SUN106 TaxID=2978348 RepID=UPI003D36FC93